MPSPAEFVDRWKTSEGSELGTSQSFLIELCHLLGVSPPDPATADEGRYVFERPVSFAEGGHGRIDLYRRGCFVLESKQGSERRTAEEEALLPDRRKRTGTAIRGTPAWDRAMTRARNQAERYAKALPAGDGWPPFLIVADVGHCLDLYADFSQAGKAYVPFPDPTGYRLKLADLLDEQVCETLRAIWTDPLSLDPARKSAAVTRELASRLAALAKLLEREHPPEAVAGFLMRCLFTMFAEDIELLAGSGRKSGARVKPFTDLLRNVKDNPDHFSPMVEDLWRAMDRGSFSPAIAAKVRHFNGGLFAETTALPLSKTQIALLLEAAESEWKNVEPAIFGTLLERALDPVERHKLGAHYTPRAYVERLVLPTVIEPLRSQWNDVYAAATKLEEDDKTAAAKLVRGYYDTLTHTRVLDPACGSGNFLYVTMEHMKRLEGEVAAVLRRLGQEPPIVGVDPGHFLGMEVNPRAREIADLVLWIGYIQWHLRSRGAEKFGDPILQKLRNIECRDAVLAHDGTELVLGDDGKPLSRWDGRTTKPHPVTGEEVPDDKARVPVLRYKNPRKAEWPHADYIVGNPPYIGNKRMRLALTDEYVEALRAAHDDVPETADFVLHWWNQGALQLRKGSAKRFGFIATNSLGQSFNRGVIQRHLDDAAGISVVFAIPDHPWVDSAHGAAVRISMTSCVSGQMPGLLCEVTEEAALDTDAPRIALSCRSGIIHSDLTIGADLVRASKQKLRSNAGLAFMGVTPAGDGFRIPPQELERRGYRIDALPSVVKKFVIGRDLLGLTEERFIIDFYGLQEHEAREKYPDLYQWLADRVRPQRLQNKRAAYRDRWWIFAEPRGSLRGALQGLQTYVATVRVSKFKVFQHLSTTVLPDSGIIAIALEDSYYLGVLSSTIHLVWALSVSGRMGVGNDPYWNVSVAFEPFPFPACTESQQARIRELAEALDGHRKQQQALHPGLTMTGMYNVLEKLRAGESLSSREQAIHEQGLVSVLKQLHDELDAAVAEAYGWPADLSDEEILERLVALNKERAAEEAKGIVRWLRPEFQNPGGAVATQRELIPEPEAAAPGVPAAKTRAAKRNWPKSLPDRVRAVRTALSESAAPLSAKELASGFAGAKAKGVAELLETLVDLGQARRVGERYAA